MFQYLCYPAVIDVDNLIVKPRGEVVVVDAANEADACVIAKHHLPLKEGEQMAVIQKARVINVGAWTGFPLGQGGKSDKIEGSNDPEHHTDDGKGPAISRTSD